MQSFYDELIVKANEARAIAGEQAAHEEMQSMSAARFTGGGGGSAVATVTCEAIGSAAPMGATGSYTVTFRIIDEPKDAFILGTGAVFSDDGLEVILPIMKEDQVARKAKDDAKARYAELKMTMPDAENKVALPKFDTEKKLHLRLGSTMVICAPSIQNSTIMTIKKGNICMVQIRAVLDEPKYPDRPSIRAGQIDIIDSSAQLSPEKTDLRLCAMFMCNDTDRKLVQMRYPLPAGGPVAVKTIKELKDLKPYQLTPETAFMKNAIARLPVFRSVPQPFLIGMMNTGRPIVAIASPPGMSDDFQGLPGGTVKEEQFNRLYFNIQLDIFFRKYDRLPKAGKLSALELKAELLAIYNEKMRVQYGVTQWQISIGVKNHAQLFPGMAGFQVICATPFTVDCYHMSSTAISTKDPEPSPLTLNVTVMSGGSEKKPPVEKDEALSQVDLPVGVYNCGFRVDWEAVEGICKAQNDHNLPGLQINVDPGEVDSNNKMRQPTKLGTKSLVPLETNELNSNGGPIVNCFEHNRHLNKLRDTHDFIAVPNLLKRFAGPFVNGETTEIAKLYHDMLEAKKVEARAEVSNPDDEAAIAALAESHRAHEFGKLLVLYLEGGKYLPKEYASAFNKGSAPRADMILYAVKRDYAKARKLTTDSSSNEVDILMRNADKIFPPFDCISFARRKRTAEEDELEARKRAEPTDDDLADMDLDQAERDAEAAVAARAAAAPADLGALPLAQPTAMDSAEAAEATQTAEEPAASPVFGDDGESSDSQDVEPRHEYSPPPLP
jgi:hypothetical protein